MVKLSHSVKLFCKKMLMRQLFQQWPFVATINALKYNGISPIFMDCDSYFNIDENKTINFIKKNTKFVNGKTVNKKTGKTISAIIIICINAVIDRLIPLCKRY